MLCEHSKNIQEMLKKVFQPKIISCQLMLRHRSIHSYIHVNSTLAEDLEASAPWEMLESELVSVTTVNPGLLMIAVALPSSGALIKTSLLYLPLRIVQPVNIRNHICSWVL